MRLKIIRVIIFCFALFSMLSSSFVTSAFSRDKWWSEFGTPEYGGTLTSRAASLEVISYDPTNMVGSRFQYCYDSLFFFDWTLDRTKWAFSTGWVPPEYKKGLLAESWKQTNSMTITVRLRKGVKWQNKPPVNGREFTSEDVIFNFDRILGTGHGYTQPDPFLANQYSSLERVIAVDKYTVQFKLKKPSALALSDIVSSNSLMVAPEWVALDGPPKNPAPPPPPGAGPPPPPGPPGGAVSAGPTGDWHNAVGTGPWILDNVVQGSSITFKKNPDYWGFDERFPENKLPYADIMKVVSIPNLATALAALRTYKVDMQTDPEDFSWQQASMLNKSNPEIITAKLPGTSNCLDMRCDKKPFNDIRVRKALQMAINRPAIAKSHFGGTVDGTPAGIMTQLYSDYAYMYDKWPKSLKETYSYNPQKAKKLLAEAGYPNGFKTNCIVGSAEDTQLLQIIKSQFMDIGVDMDIRLMEMGSYMNFVMSGKNDAMDMERWASMMSAPNTDFGLGVRTSKSMFNFTHNNDAKYDSLYQQMQNATSLSKAQALCRELDKYALEQNWAVHIVPTAQYIAWQPYVKGYSGEFIGFADAAAATRARLWINQKEKKDITK